jgi:hypothetical protein
MFEQNQVAAIAYAIAGEYVSEHGGVPHGEEEAIYSVVRDILQAEMEFGCFGQDLEELDERAVSALVRGVNEDFPEEVKYLKKLEDRWPVLNAFITKISS